MSGDDRIDEVIAGHMPQRLTPEPFDQGPKTDLAGVERRVSALERHLFDPCETSDPSETEENADKPPSASEALELVKGSIAGPGYIYGDRADRANALLGSVETIKATGGAVETHGVRIEPCDEYGRTDTTERLERVIRERDAADRALNVNRRETSALLEKLGKARAERDVALKGAESAEKEIGRLDRAVHDLGTQLRLVINGDGQPIAELLAALRRHAPGLLPDEYRVDTIPEGEEIGRGLIVCGAQRLADVAEGRIALVDCELPDGHAEPHHAGRRHAVTW